MHEGGVDLSSAVFLGPAPRVAFVGALASGKPSVLEEPPGTRRITEAWAASHDVEDAVLARSAFHGLLDAIEATAGNGSTLLVDGDSYEVARWAVAAACAGSRARKEVRVVTYRHLDADDAALRSRAVRGPVVVVTDGLCGSCLRPAPLGRLCSLARRTGGRVVVDDTLAAGVLGTRTAGSGPLGLGGGGTAAWLGAAGRELVVVSSLAKGYGVPLAVVTGPRVVVDRVRRTGSARTYASGPSAADLAALLALPRRDELERRRRRLSELVDRTRRRVRRVGLAPLGIPFPMVHMVGGGRPLELRDVLARRGVRVLVTAGRCRTEAALTLCLRSDLSMPAVDRLVEALANERRRWVV